MIPWLLAVIGLLVLLILILLLRIHLIHRTAREITDSLTEHLRTDTNTLISVSGRDRQMRLLADVLNKQLRLLRLQRLRFCQGDQELKDAVAGLAHDLRTPLTAVCGYLDLLKQEEVSENAARYLSIISGRTTAMKQLTEELFTYSIVTSAHEMVLTPLDLRRALEESLLSLCGAMQQRSIEPEVCLPEKRIERNLDPSAVSRIFSNIISNALKYSDGDFSVCMEESGVIHFSNHAARLTAVDVSRLFDRFYTVETARHSTGLGLSVARHLTERMGGTIRAEYEDGCLSITLDFPRKD